MVHYLAYLTGMIVNSLVLKNGHAPKRLSWMDSRDDWQYIEIRGGQNRYQGQKELMEYVVEVFGKLRPKAQVRCDCSDGCHLENRSNPISPIPYFSVEACGENGLLLVPENPRKGLLRYISRRFAEAVLTDYPQVIPERARA
ncbi:MAG: hypothetical protein JW727_00580 [Candidatus Aenigmarchaeota archaeon]|nr:hypothetical protein [Candidatus Aenigmarchaeota archaeon]